MNRRSWVSILSVTILAGGWLAGYLGIPRVVEDGVWPWDHVVGNLVGAERWVHHLQTRALPLVATLPLTLFAFWVFSRGEWLHPDRPKVVPRILHLPLAVVFMGLVILHLGAAMIQGNAKPIGALSHWGDRAFARLSYEEVIAARGQEGFISDAWIVLFDRNLEQQSDYRHLLEAYLQEGGEDLDYRLDMAAWQAGRGNLAGGLAWVQPELGHETVFWTALLDPSVVVGGRAQRFPGLAPRVALEDAYYQYQRGNPAGIRRSLELASRGRNPGDACLRSALWMSLGEYDLARQALEEDGVKDWVRKAARGYRSWWKPRSPRETAMWTAIWVRLAFGLHLLGEIDLSLQVWNDAAENAFSEDMPYLVERYVPLREDLSLSPSLWQMDNGTAAADQAKEDQP